MTERSSGIPRGRALAGITRIIAARARTKTFERPSTSKGDLDQTTETTTEFPETVWLYDPDENSIDATAGERVTGDLGGLIVAPTDVQRDDRITHGGVEYEVDSIVGAPDDDQTDYYQISFIRRQ